MLTGVVLIIPLVFTEITQIIGIMIENFSHIKESIQLL
jgi:hypothetical protein